MKIFAKFLVSILFTFLKFIYLSRSYTISVRNNSKLDGFGIRYYNLNKDKTKLENNQN